MQPENLSLIHISGLLLVHDGDAVFGMAERNFGGHDPENNVGLSSFLGKAGTDGIQLVFQGEKEGTPGNIFGFRDLFFQGTDEEVFFFAVQDVYKRQVQIHRKGYGC